MRKWSVATLVAFVILTSPFTIVGAVVVSGVATNGVGFFDAAKIVVDVWIHGDE
jgi:hypothetical protein